MSSPPYSTDLDADPSLRLVVLWSGLGMTLAGIPVIAGLPVPAGWKVPASAAWALAGVWQVFALRAAYRRYSGVRLYADGSIEVLRPGDVGKKARLLDGSFVLPRLAWLRIRTEDGRTSGELMRGRLPENEAWRRLQVIWRHLGRQG